MNADTTIYAYVGDGFVLHPQCVNKEDLEELTPVHSWELEGLEDLSCDACDEYIIEPEDEPEDENFADEPGDPQGHGVYECCEVCGRFIKSEYDWNTRHIECDEDEPEDEPEDKSFDELYFELYVELYTDYPGCFLEPDGDNENGDEDLDDDEDRRWYPVFGDHPAPGG